MYRTEIVKREVGIALGTLIYMISLCSSMNNCPKMNSNFRRKENQIDKNEEVNTQIEILTHKRVPNAVYLAFLTTTRDIPTNLEILALNFTNNDPKNLKELTTAAPNASDHIKLIEIIHIEHTPSILIYTKDSNTPFLNRTNLDTYFPSMQNTDSFASNLSGLITHIFTSPVNINLEHILHNIYTIELTKSPKIKPSNKYTVNFLQSLQMDLNETIKWNSLLQSNSQYKTLNKRKTFSSTDNNESYGFEIKDDINNKKRTIQNNSSKPKDQYHSEFKELNAQNKSYTSFDIDIDIDIEDEIKYDKNYTSNAAPYTVSINDTINNNKKELDNPLNKSKSSMTSYVDSNESVESNNLNKKKKRINYLRENTKYNSNTFYNTKSKKSELNNNVIKNKSIASNPDVLNDKEDFRRRNTNKFSLNLKEINEMNSNLNESYLEIKEENEATNYSYKDLNEEIEYKFNKQKDCSDVDDLNREKDFRENIMENKTVLGMFVGFSMVLVIIGIYFFKRAYKQSIVNK